jgi:glycosyltransferase involved in cell wall biosynthesis
MNKEVVILGTRGIPAQHGGFETFAEELSLFLNKNNWNVIVYCQVEGKGEAVYKRWNGITLVEIPVKGTGAKSTIVFDFKSIVHSLRYKSLHLTLGYNTAVFNLLQRMYGIPNIINMDGIEWKRQKWGGITKSWFWLNERLGCYLGNHLVADHPKIEDHLATRVSRSNITMIPYGGSEVNNANENLLDKVGVTPNKYAVVIARPEPENSFLEIVKSFSAKSRDYKLVVLGNFKPDNKYHKMVLDAASDDVIFPGAIYDADIVGALRFYARFYVHGHQVGGTNPSLVEALGAGCSVLAHDNQFNRWVANDAACYFTDESDLLSFFDKDFSDDQLVLEKKQNAKKQFVERFKWDDVLEQYENLLKRFCKKG